MAGKARADKKFEPLCEWKHEEDRDILEIQLQGFKKEQLRIKLMKTGTLKIFGERPEASEKSEFHKEIDLPSNTYINHTIHAKFQSSGHLYIIMPKINRETNCKITSEPSKIDQTPKLELPKGQATMVPPPSPPPPSHDCISGAKVQQIPPSDGNTLPEFEFHSHNPLILGLRVREMVVSLAATAVAIAVLVAYVVYMYKSTFDGV